MNVNERLDRLEKLITTAKSVLWFAEVEMESMRREEEVRREKRKSGKRRRVNLNPSRN